MRVLRKVREAGIVVVGVTGRGARLIELCRRDLPEADFFVLAQGAYVVDQRGPEPRVLRRARIAGADLAECLRRLEEAVGPLVRAGRGERRAAVAAVGRLARGLALPGVDPVRPRAALAGPAYKGFAHAPDLHRGRAARGRPRP